MGDKERGGRGRGERGEGGRENEREGDGIPEEGVRFKIEGENRGGAGGGP